MRLGELIAFLGTTCGIGLVEPAAFECDSNLTKHLAEFTTTLWANG